MTISQSVETNRLYHYENRSRKTLPKYLTEERNMSFLQKLAEKVWSKHGRKGIRCPSVAAWNGIISSGTKKGKGWSYCLGYTEIKLAKRHRNVMVLLHELVHAIGYETHGRNFAKKYLELLTEYGKVEEGEVVIGMGMFGIKV